MAERFTVVCGEEQARAVRSLARRYGLTEEQVLAQLVDAGLEEIEEQRL